MERFAFILFLSAVGCQKVVYEPHFSSSKTFKYGYVGVLFIGHEEKNINQSGMRLSCSVEIAGVGEDVFLMKVNKVSIEEFQGILHRDRFISEPELTKKMSEQLVHPIKFEYSNGHVGNIFTTPKVSNTAVNIVRGILSLLDVTIKNGPNTYTLYEPNIHGTCQSTYYLEEDAKNEEFLVKRSINLENCHEKASKVMGMAYAVTCENCEKIATNNAGMVTYSYVIKQSAEGSFIKEASAKEVQAFSPYNVKQGCSLLEVSKTLSLSEVTKAAVSPPSLPYENRGNLKYVFGDEINQMPIIFVTSNNLEKKIKEMLQHLVKTTQNKEAFSNEYFLKLAQLFRYVTIAEIEALWKEFRGDKDYRRWLLDVITSIPTSNSLIFLRNRIRNHELSVMEAAQGLLFTFHLISADVNTVKHAQEFLTVPFIQNSWILRKTVILAYGSLVYKSCQDPTQCPSDMLKPLYDLASSAFREKNEDDMLLALKALGNAGQLSSIKTIMTFLPVQPTARTELSTRVHTAAVLSLRNIAHKDPRKIQEIVLKVLLDGSLDAEVRMHACLVLFETRPSLSLVLTVVEAMLKETNLQVASFCYSQMKSLLWSTTPDNTELVAACNLAVKILRQKFERLNQWRSKVFHYDYFDDQYLSGFGADVYLMKNIAGFLPNTIIHRQKTYFFGTVSDYQEFGFNIRGMYDLWKNISSTETGGQNMENVIKGLSSDLFKWKSTPAEKPHLSIYIKAFGQEWFFADVSRDFNLEASQVISVIAGQVGSLAQAVDRLLKGFNIRGTNAILFSEIRYITTTCLGLPVENSQYYTFLSQMEMDWKTHTQVKAPKYSQPRMAELLNSEIVVDTDSFLSHIQHFIHFHGVNSDLMKIGSEYHAKLDVSLPVKAKFRVNVKDQTFDMESDFSHKEHQLMEVTSQLFTAIRKTEQPSGTRMTLILSSSALENIIKERFDSTKRGWNSEDEVGKDIFPEHLSQYEKHQSDVDTFLPKTHSWCAEADAIGLKMCLEAKVANARFLRESPLYHFLGNSYFKLVLKPAKTAAEIQNIRLKLHIPQRNPKIAENLKVPLVEASVEAETNSKKTQGYKSVVYMTRSSTVENIQLLISEEHVNSRWKFCSNATVEKHTSNAASVLQWGQECAQNEISATVTAVEKSKGLLDIKLKLHWEKLSKHLQQKLRQEDKTVADMVAGFKLTYAELLHVAEYIPGIAFYLEWNEIYQQNRPKEISATLRATSSSTFDAVVRTPKITIYKRGLQSFIPFSNIFKIKDSSHFMSLLTEAMKVQCSISGEQITTFNEVTYRLDLPEGCYHVLVQDCTAELRFQVLIRKMGSKGKEIFVKTPAGNLIIYHDGYGQPVLTVQNTIFPLSNLPYKDPTGKLSVKLQDMRLLVEAQAFGLDKLYFSRGDTKIVIEPWWKGKTCGLCGWADGEHGREFRMPDTKVAKNTNGFIFSWLLSDESYASCDLLRELVTLNKAVGVTGEQKRCTSLEPVLRCKSRCCALETVSVPIPFDCETPGSNDRWDATSRLESTTISQDAHVSCDCTSSDCT